MDDCQFVTVRFAEGDKRTYTYAHNIAGGIEPLKIGEIGRVEDPRGGWKRVTVVALPGVKPNFACKAITRYVPPEVEPTPEREF